MAESSNRFIALDKLIKKYIYEQLNKKTRAKTRRNIKVSLKSFQKGKYAISIIDDKEFYQARNYLEAGSKRLYKSKVTETCYTQLKH